MYTDALQPLGDRLACCDCQLQKAYPEEALGNRISGVSQQAGQECFSGHSQCCHGKEGGLPSAQTNDGLLQNSCMEQLVKDCMWGSS